MWSRDELKRRAKTVLAGRYWWALLFIVIVGGIASISNSIVSGVSMLMDILSRTSYTLEELFEISFFMGISAFSVQMMFTYVASFVVVTFVTGPLSVSTSRFFMDSANGEDDIGKIVYGFSNSYINVAKTSFFKQLYIFLWSLLFVIPGVIKKYEYYFTSYIQAENPSLDTNRVLEISKKMTQGHKWDIFVLELSFIGWYILGMFALCVGVAFVYPYQIATNTQLYFTLRYNAVLNGITSESELTGNQ